MALHRYVDVAVLTSAPRLAFLSSLLLFTTPTLFIETRTRTNATAAPPEWVSFNKSRAGYAGGAMWDKLVGAELYEHSNDPGSEAAPPRACDWDYEATNLANVAAHAATRDTLSRQLHEGWRSALPPV